MPETFTEFLLGARDYIWWGILGLCGATINLLLHRAAGAPLSKATVTATLMSGSLLAVTGSSIIGSWIGVDVKIAGGLGFCALLTGMLGIKIATLVINMPLFLPFRSEDTGK